MSAWETVWVCVLLTLFVLLLDAWQARSGGQSGEQAAREQLRAARQAKVKRGGNHNDD